MPRENHILVVVIALVFVVVVILAKYSGLKHCLGLLREEKLGQQILVSLPSTSRRVVPKEVTIGLQQGRELPEAREFVISKSKCKTPTATRSFAIHLSICECCIKKKQTIVIVLDKHSAKQKQEGRGKKDEIDS